MLNPENDVSKNRVTDANGLSTDPGAETKAAFHYRGDALNSVHSGAEADTVSNTPPTAAAYACTVWSDGARPCQ